MHKKKINKAIPQGIVAHNRRAKFDYSIIDTVEAGIVLLGSEVKSLRLGRASINESYATNEFGQIVLVNSNIPEYNLAASGQNHDPKRVRRLLVHKNERDKIKEELSALNTGYVNAEGGRITGSMEAAKAKLKKAVEDQDTEAMAAAQLEIGKLGADQARYEQLKTQQEAMAQRQTSEKEVEIPKTQEQPVKDPKAEAWATENEWFGRDKIMTNVAYAIHEDLVNQGVDPRTDYYYTEIDKRMRDNLPHKFEQDSSSEEPAAQQPVQTVASANRNRGTGRNVVKLSSSEAAIAKRLGLSNEQYASEKLKLQRR